MMSRGDPQCNFFDQQLFSKMIPQDHPLAQIRAHIDFSFVNAEVSDCYHSDIGRPSFPPETLFRILFLEVWANLSDVQVCRELQYNILYRWFCGIGWEDNVPDDTTLVVFRRRLGEHKFRRLFEQVVEQAKRKKLLSGKWVILDGTKMVSHSAVRTNLELAREGKRMILRQIRRYDKKAAKELEQHAAPIADREHATYEQLLDDEMQSGMRLIEKAAPLAATHKKIESAIKKYSRFLLGEKITSFSDTDARWGFRNKHEPFVGYKAHAACDEGGIVTGVEVTRANESELVQAEPIIEDLCDRGMKPLKFAADKAYDDSGLREEFARKGIRTYVPSKRRIDRLERQGFRYDDKRGHVCCRAGKQSIGSTPHKDGGFIYYFSERDCSVCEMRSNCLSKSQSRKSVYVKPSVRKCRSKGMRRAMQIRRTIERMFGDAKRWHGMGRARYTGLGRVTIQVLLTFMVCNVKKMLKKILETKPKHRERTVPRWREYVLRSSKQRLFVLYERVVRTSDRLPRIQAYRQSQFVSG